jgi:hypothetical protein
LTVTAPTRFPAMVNTTELNAQQTDVSNAAISPYTPMPYPLGNKFPEAGL